MAPPYSDIPLVKSQSSIVISTPKLMKRNEPEVKVFSRVAKGLF